MKNIYIQKWYGRLGNNIIQVLNAILIALYYNYNIILPQHNYFNTTYIIINDKITTENEKINSSENGNFFFWDEIKNIDKQLYKLNNEKAFEILKSSFNFTNFKSHNLKNNDILIHMRGGDIFIHPHGAGAYIMPPLSYYINIIKSIKFDNIMDKSVIYLISEDTLNPCVNELLKLYPQIIYKTQSLDDDISLILSAHNIISSFGTFISSLINLSSNIKNLYDVSYDTYYYKVFKNINVYTTDLTVYHNLMMPWRNTEEQQKLMLDYKCENSFIKNDKYIYINTNINI
jgi:hypothetical protein